MARSTGPILAAGAITLAMNTLFLDKNRTADYDDIGIRITIATGLAAGGFYLLEQVSETLAVGLAWVALVAVLFVRTDRRIPTPVESINIWFKMGGR